MLANTIIQNNLTESMPLNSTASCDTEKAWPLGSKLINHLKSNSFNGLSGRIQFNKDNGLRNNLTFSIDDKIKGSIDLVIYFFK